MLLPIGQPSGGDEEIRTLDPLLAGQVLSQLSYTPRCFSGSDPENRTTIDFLAFRFPSRTRFSFFLSLVRWTALCFFAELSREISLCDLSP